MRGKRYKWPDIRRGDWWEFTSNEGVIMRHVLSVASGIVLYDCNGFTRRCQLETFKRWTFGAELTCAEDWSGR